MFGDMHTIGHQHLQQQIETSLATLEMGGRCKLGGAPPRLQLPKGAVVARAGLRSVARRTQQSTGRKLGGSSCATLSKLKGALLPSQAHRRGLEDTNTSCIIMPLEERIVHAHSVR